MLSLVYKIFLGIDFSYLINSIHLFFFNFSEYVLKQESKLNL